MLGFSKANLNTVLGGIDEFRTGQMPFLCYCGDQDQMYRPMTD